MIPKVYEASTENKVEDYNYSNIGLSGVRPSDSRLFTRQEQLINSEINVIKGTVVLEGVAKKLDLAKRWEINTGNAEDDIKAAAGKVGSMVSVEPKRDSSIIVISVKAKEPKISAEIANAVAEEYIEKSVIFNTMPEAAQFYKDKLDREQAELNDLQDKFRKLKVDNKVVNLDVEVEQKLMSRGSFEERLTQVKTNIVSKAAKIQKMRTFLRENTDILIPIPEIANNRLVQDLNYRQVNLQLELENLKKRYTDEERQVKLVKSQIEQVRARIRIEVQNIFDQETVDLGKLETEKSALESSIRNIDKELMDKTSVEAEYNNLKLLIQDKNTIVSDLNKRYTDSLYAGQSDSRLGKVKQISPALVPRDSVFPNMKLNLLFAIPFAFMLSLATVIGLDYFDRTFTNPDKVEQVLNLPVLASIQEMDLKKNPIFK